MNPKTTDNDGDTNRFMAIGVGLTREEGIILLATWIVIFWRMGIHLCCGEPWCLHLLEQCGAKY